jgi:hypothetical protein
LELITGLLKRVQIRPSSGHILEDDVNGFSSEMVKNNRSHFEKNE